MIKKSLKLVSDEGVSEIIGAILLISLSVIGIAVISVMLFSSAPSEVVPVVDILAGKSGTGEFYLYNNGGDSLRSGEYRVLVDLNDGNGYVPGDFSEPPGGTWSSGDAIKYDGPGMPVGTKIVYTGGGTETLLSSSPVIYSNQTVANVSLIGDIGIVPGTTNEDFNVTQIIITNDEDLELDFDTSKDSPRVNITIDSDGFVADRADVVLYNYENLPNNANNLKAAVQKMVKLNDFDFTTEFTELNNLFGNGIFPTNISMTVIAYNESLGESHMMNVIFDVEKK
jgi:hypothetical protein